MNNLSQERSVDRRTGKTYYTHRKLRNAYLSIKRNMPYLWTWYYYIELGVPNTNNGLDGKFTDLKILLSGKTFLSLKKTGLNPFRNSTLSLYFVVPTQTNESDAQKYTFYRTATILPVIKFPRQARN